MDSNPTSEHASRSDGELLQRYLDSRDDGALTELITRHAALVRGVCQRVLGNTPDADDAFQATFLVLVRHGELIRKPQSLAAWLFGVAHRISKRHRRQRSRAVPLVREEAAMIETDQLTELAHRHDVSLFDAELARLPEKYRAPIVLHHLEGKTQREVAEELQLTEGAVDGLLKRGRNELRVRLARQGVVLGVTLLAVQSAQAALAGTTPPALIAATVQGMLTLDPLAHPSMPHTPASRLAHQEISAMGLFQMTKVTAWTLVGSLLLGAAGVGMSTTRHPGTMNLAGVIASEIAVAQFAAEPVAEVTAEAVAETTTDLEVSDADDLPEGTPLNVTGDIIGGAVSLDPSSGFAAAAQPPADLRDGKLSDDPILKKLDHRTKFSFVDTRLRDVLDYLKDLHGFNIQIDDATIKRDGTSTEQAVSLELSDVTLRSALKLMLEPLGLDYIIENEVMKITSKQAAENQHEMRVYKLEPLWAGADAEGNRFEFRPGAGSEQARRLEAFVKDTVGGAWKEPGTAGLGGTIQVLPQGLAIRHNQRTLLAVERLLAQLDMPAAAGKAAPEKSADQRPEANEGDTLATPGAIRRVDPKTKTVVINLGTADSIRPRTRIDVLEQLSDGTQQLQGVIEITRVLGEHLAEAKILQEDLKRPIAVGARSVVRLSASNAQPPKEPIPAATKPIAEVLNESTRVDADEIPLRDVLKQLSALHGLAIRIDGFEIGDVTSLDQRVHLKAQDVTLKQVLKKLLDPLALDYLIENDGVRVTSASRAQYIHGGRHESRIINRAHAGESIAVIGEIDFDGDGKSDRQMFYELLKESGINLADQVDDAGRRSREKLREDTKFVVIGKIPDSRLKTNRTEREQAQKVMEQLRDIRKEAQQSGVRMVTLNDFLDYIGQPKANPIPDPEQPRPKDFRQRKPSEVRIETALHEATEISFVDTSLRDALGYLEDLHNFEIMINQQAIAKDGNDANAIQINVELSGSSLQSALNLMLEPHGLDYLIKDEVLMVTSRAHAQDYQELRVYDIRDLAPVLGTHGEKNEFWALQDAVGAEWIKVAGTGGTMEIIANGLVVRHNQRTHREIENLIDQLRRAKSAE